MTRPTLAAAIATALCGLVAAPALAQNVETAPAAAAPMKAKPKPPPGGPPTVTVMVTNSRKTDLVQLQAAESGSGIWKKVLGPVKTGKQASAIMPRSYNCRLDLHGTFADGELMDASDVDVCAQQTLNLTD